MRASSSYICIHGHRMATAPRDKRTDSPKSRRPPSVQGQICLVGREANAASVCVAKTPAATTSAPCCMNRVRCSRGSGPIPRCYGIICAVPSPSSCGYGARPPRHKLAKASTDEQRWVCSGVTRHPALGHNPPLLFFPVRRPRWQSRARKGTTTIAQAEPSNPQSTQVLCCNPRLGWSVRHPENDIHKASESAGESKHKARARGKNTQRNVVALFQEARAAIGNGRHTTKHHDNHVCHTHITA